MTVVPLPMLSRRHDLQIFDAIVAFVAVVVMNHVTVGNIAEVKTPNCLVKRDCAIEMPLFGFGEDLTVEFRVRLVDDFDCRRRGLCQFENFLSQVFVLAFKGFVFRKKLQSALQVNFFIVT